MAEGARLKPIPTTEATAKAVAPLSMPMMPGVARRLRASVCIRQPDSPKAAPLASAANSRGRRNCSTTKVSSIAPCPLMTAQILPGDSGFSPRHR